MRNNLVTACFLLIAAAAFISSCQNEKELEYARYYTNGKQLYEKHCQNCHSSTGAGLGELIPPLTDSVFLKQNRNILSCIIKNGLDCKLTINKKEYEGQMPANSQLADIEIAELVTYITNSFGNKQSLLTAADAQSDLKKCN